MLTAQTFNYSPTVMEPPFDAPNSSSLLPASAGSEQGASGYLMSSMELRAGLEVRAISAAKLPLDLLRELLRMHASWPKQAVSGQKSAYKQ